MRSKDTADRLTKPHLRVGLSPSQSEVTEPIEQIQHLPVGAQGDSEDRTANTPMAQSSWQSR